MSPQISSTNSENDSNWARMRSSAGLQMPAGLSWASYADQPNGAPLPGTPAHHDTH